MQIHFRSIPESEKAVEAGLLMNNSMKVNLTNFRFNPICAFASCHHPRLHNMDYKMLTFLVEICIYLPIFHKKLLQKRRTQHRIIDFKFMSTICGQAIE